VYIAKYNVFLFYFSLVVCTLTSVILAATRIEYDAKFNIIDIGFLRYWVVTDLSLTTYGKRYLITLFKEIKRTDALRNKYSRGQSFVFLWVTLIIVFLALLVSLYSFKVWLKTGVEKTVRSANFSEETEEISTNAHKKRGFHSFSDRFYWWPSFPSLPSFPSFPSLPSLPSLPSMPSLPSFDGDFGGGGGGDYGDCGGDD